MPSFSALPLTRSRIRTRQVRPRALLHVTAMCLLLEAATVSAEAQKPAVPLAPLKTESTRKPWEVNPLGRTESTRKAWESKVRLSKTASTLKGPKQPLAKEFDPRLETSSKDRLQVLILFGSFQEL